jgi:transcriptional regulator with XRE-family HTH domain
MAGCSESYVSKLERDVLALRDLRLARRLAAALGLPLAELLDPLVGARPPGSPPAAAASRQGQRAIAGSVAEVAGLAWADRYDTGAAGPALDDDLEDEPMQRRALLVATGKLAGGVAVSLLLGALDPDEGDLLLAALRDPDRHLGERVVRLLERHDAHAQRRTGALPAGMRLEQASEQLAIVRRLRPAARRVEHAQRLAVLEVQAARLLGRLLGYWRHDPAAAARLFDLALQAAHDAGPDAATLRAYTLGGLAYLHTELGDRRQAVTAATQALQVAQASPVRALRSWLSATAALAYAGVGDRRACQEAVAAAAGEFVPPGAGDPVWLRGFVTRGLLVENRAASQLRLGQVRAALGSLEEAERLLGARPGRIQQQAVLLAHRAQALARDRQPDLAAQAAVDALTIALPVGYGLVVGQLDVLWRQRLARVRRAVPAVGEVEELLQLARHAGLAPPGSPA